MNRLNPVADTDSTAHSRPAVGPLAGVIMTVGVTANGVPKVMCTCAPVVGEVPVPNLTRPERLSGPAVTSGAGAEVPAPDPAVAVLVAPLTVMKAGLPMMLAPVLAPRSISAFFEGWMIVVWTVVASTLMS